MVHYAQSRSAKTIKLTYLKFQSFINGDFLVNKKILASIIVIIVLFSFVALAACTSQTFTVPGLQTTTTTLNLNKGNVVSGNVNVSGGVGNDINFYISDPNGNNVVNLSHVTQSSYSFTAQSTGTYTVHFDNTIGLLQKSVTFTYNTTPSVLGLPQDTFIEILSIIIVAIAVAAVIVLVLSHRGKRKPAVT
jgi:hypothetical protein